MLLPPTTKVLKEQVHSSGDMFTCGVEGCVKVFQTGVAYIDHLNAEHDYKINDGATAAKFLDELHKRIDRAPRKRGRTLQRD